MTAPFDEAAARKLLDAWPEVPGLNDLVAAFVEARAAVEAVGGGGEPVAWSTPNAMDAGDYFTCNAVIAERWRADGYAVNALYTAPQPAAEAWRDIAIPAPYSDHMRTLLLNWKGRGVCECYWDEDEEFEERPDGWKSPSCGWRSIGDQCIPINQEDVTHWRPLPTPPGASPNPPADAADAVGIVERMREEWDRFLRRKRNPSPTEAWTILTKLSAADEILAALRGEAR